MPDVEEIIGTAMQDAGLAEMDDFGQLQPTDGDDTPAPEPGDEAAPVETKAEEVVDDKAKEKAPEGDELDRELASLGLHGKDEGGKETRIRYSKIRRIWENYKIKYGADLKAQHDKALAEVQGKLTTAQQRSDHMGRIEAMIDNDPRRYFEMLAAASPKVRALLEQPIFQAAAKAAVKDAQGGDDPMPKPDARYQDGSVGYSEEGLQKLREWDRRQTLNEMDKRVEAKYGAPIQAMTQERREQAVRQQSMERVQKNVALARQVYGKIFDDDFGAIGQIKADSAIMKALSNGQGLTFLEACAVALVPKMQADRNTMREELLTEVNERPKAARRSTPEVAASESKDTPKTDEEIILAEMRKARMI